MTYPNVVRQVVRDSDQFEITHAHIAAVLTEHGHAQGADDWDALLDFYKAVEDRWVELNDPDDNDAVGRIRLRWDEND